MTTDTGVVPRYLDTTAAAHLLGVSRKHLQNLRVKGGGPRFARIGDAKAVRYDLADLQVWVDGRKTTSTSQEVEEA